jgi:hypothetical protein
MWMVILKKIATNLLMDNDNKSKFYYKYLIEILVIIIIIKEFVIFIMLVMLGIMNPAINLEESFNTFGNDIGNKFQKIAEIGQDFAINHPTISYIWYKYVIPLIMIYLIIRICYLIYKIIGDIYYK